MLMMSALGIRREKNFLIFSHTYVMLNISRVLIQHYMTDTLNLMIINGFWRNRKTVSHSNAHLKNNLLLQKFKGRFEDLCSHSSILTVSLPRNAHIIRTVDIII